MTMSRYSSALCSRPEQESSFLTREQIEEISNRISKKFAKEISEQLDKNIKSFKKEQLR